MAQVKSDAGAIRNQADRASAQLQPEPIAGLVETDEILRRRVQQAKPAAPKRVAKPVDQGSLF